MIIGQKEFDVWNRTYVMGILNTTPDSFSDGGRYCDREKALRQAEKLVFDGADIIDVGGESTRPGCEAGWGGGRTGAGPFRHPADS